MNHDIQSAWVTAELANLIKLHPEFFFKDLSTDASLSAYASREKRSKWPYADGLVSIENSSRQYGLAMEFKQTNEGTHGILTALGQANAYIHKGYAGAAIVLPSRYDSLTNPGEHLKEIVDQNEPELPIAIYTYEEPDTSLASPFQGKLFCVRTINLTSLKPSITNHLQGRTETQWAHLREGSSDPYAFFVYLKIAKTLPLDNVEDASKPIISIPHELTEAIGKLSSSNPLKYLSNSVSEDSHNKIWRHFWFTYIFNEKVLPIWKNKADGIYLVNDYPSEILLPDGSKKFFFGAPRVDSIKNVLINELNNKQITEEDAWKKYAKNVHDRAHSYREDIDSGLEDLGMLANDGRPTELGYRFVDAAERNGSVFTGTAKTILGAAILKNGQIGALLHYIYKLSEAEFKQNSLAFSSQQNSKFQFNQLEYLVWLENQLSNNLKVMRKVSLRGGTQRRPFQAELAIMRAFGFIDGFRLGLGMEIDWPLIQKSLDFEV